MMRKQKLLVIGAVVTALALTVSGCTKNASSNLTDSQKAAQATATDAAKGNESTASQINPVDYDKVKDGGTLRLSIQSVIPQWNLNQVDGNVADVSSVESALLPHLFDYDAGGKPTVNKDYAESVELTKDSPQTIEIKLNPKAKWSTGRALDYTDFESMWKSQNGTNKAFKATTTSGWEQVEKVAKGANDQDVIITFFADRPFADWQSILGGIVPKELTATPDTFDKLWVNKPTMTAGPFKFTSVDSTTGTVILDRDPAWWGKKAKLDKLVYTPYEGADALGAAMKAGQLDAVNANNKQLYENIKGLSGMQILKAGGPTWTHVTFGQKGEMKDLNVRQAVLLSFNRSNLISASVGNLPQPKAELQSHIWMNNQSQYKATCGDFCKQDNAKAATLLEKSGWKKNATSGYFEKDGQPLTIEYVANNPSKFQEALIPILTADMKTAGIKIDTKKVPSKDYFTQYVSKGDFGLTSFLWFGTPFPVSSSASIYETGSEQNYNRISDPEIDKLFKEAKRELDPKKATELTYKIDELIWKNAYSLPIVQQYDIYIQKANLANFGASGFASIDWSKVGFTK